MRTAEEILLQFYTQEMSEPYGHVPHEIIIKAINEARKEAIEECAERAEAFANSNTTDYKGRTTGIVDKESILSLIKEIK